MKTQSFKIRDLATRETYQPVFTLSPILLPSGKELWFLSGATQDSAHFLPEGNSWDHDSYKIGGIFTNPHDDGTTHLFAVESLEDGTVSISHFSTDGKFVLVTYVNADHAEYWCTCGDAQEADEIACLLNNK